MVCLELVISFSELTVRDLEFISMNCKETYVDGDRHAVVVDTPNEILLEELEARGILC